MRIGLVVALATATALAGCAAPAPKDDTAAAPAARSTAKSGQANVAAASGSLVSGRVTVTPMDDGVHLTGTLGGFLPNSTHAIHVHEKGDCTAADASSAGGHFNPTGSAHGRANAPVHHAGDMDNIVSGNDGTVPLDIHLRGVTLGGNAPNDIGGRSIVVHAAADDYTSQPSGNSGARVGCGVIKVLQ